MTRGVFAITLDLALASPIFAQSGADQTYGPRPLYPESWIERADYPPAARWEHKGGITRLALSIDTKGKPYRCGIVQSSGMDELDTKACEIMLRRGHFIPAKDKDGQLLPSRWSNSIDWRMFGTDPQAPVADLDLSVKSLPGGRKRALFTVVQTVTESGAIERCQEIYPSKIPAVDAEACKLAEQLQLQGPITDEQDHPVRAIRVARVSLIPESAAP